MPLKKSILLFVICFTGFISLAQKSFTNNSEDNYRAINWRVTDGLAHDKTYCMLKDVNGFLWIGTNDGLSRFDGITFKNYFYDPHKPGTIAGSEIHGLIEDSLRNIWIGTDRGLSRYDIKTDTFSNFFPADIRPAFSADITPFWATKDEIFCQEKDLFITKYNVRSFKKEILVKLNPDDMLSDRGVYTPQYSIFDSSTNSIWLLCKKFHGELLQISLSTLHREFFKLPASTEAMRYDRRRNSIWINTSIGLAEFNLHDKQFHRIETLKDLEKTNDYGRFVGIDLDRQGRVWFATHPNGVIIYNPNDESYQPVLKDSVLQSKISEPNGCIYCDRDNIPWLGFWLRKGIYQLLPFSHVATRYNIQTSGSKGLLSNNILNFVKGDRGDLWIGTGSGLVNYNTHSDNFTTYQQNDLHGVNGKFIAPIFADTIHRKLWLRTEDPGQQFFEMDIDTKVCKPVIFRDSSGHVINPKFNEDIPVHYNNGCIITAEYNKQQCIFIIKNDSAVARQVFSFPAGTINYDMLNPTPVTDHLLFLRRPDVMGNLTYKEERGKWVSINSPMDSIPWKFIVNNKVDSSYWVTVQRELIHYNYAFRQIKKYNNEDGLPRDEIYGLIPDNLGNIWLNTYRSIYQLNVKSGQISILTEKDGFTPSDFRNMGEGIGKDDNGDLYFTTAGFFDGFEKVRPATFVSPPSSVYIKSLAIKEFTPSSTGINSIQQLKLRYFQNRIIIETGTIDYYSQGKNNIRYKLEREGRNESWQYIPVNYTIRYEELPPGKYTLVMQAGNVNNEFNGPVKTIIFQINPAFWNTWWFRIMAVTCIALIFYGLIRWRLKQKFSLQLERSEKETQLADMRQKTAELKQQSTELEMQALRAQMNPHFIFNSLNSINRFILQNDRLQASEYLTKFSKLVRMILQNSQSPLIPLENELESLGLYLEMEALRFNYHFTYKISVPKDLDVEILKVPPLILQPYVENAIWHGLMHKEEKGQLNIDVSQEDDHLYFKVTDNGIGRKKASEIAGKSATKHKSMGLRITANRIAMLQSSNGTESPVKINDLVEPDGTAAGTEVVIKMPVIEGDWLN